MIAALIVLGLGWLVGGIVSPAAAQLVWMAGLVVCAIPIVFTTLRNARHGRFATDIVAALAVVGAILLEAPIAGLVVVLMLRGGAALERYAEGKASEAVRILEAAAPRRAHRLGAQDLIDVDVADIAIGDLLLIRPGELVPCDGVVTGGASDIDTSALTGEPVPITATTGTKLM